jgi:GTP cyclohydrolase I
MTQELTLDPVDPVESARPHLVRDTAPPTGRDLRIVSEKPCVDLAAAERAAEDFLAALGIDVEGDGLRQTPGPDGSRLRELFEHLAARPQTQERLTQQIADCLAAHLNPRGAGVVLEAEHACMTLRGVRALGATTITSALLGTLRADARSRSEFFALAGVAS